MIKERKGSKKEKEVITDRDKKLKILELIKIKGDNPVITSIMIADVFDKKHGDVIKKIEKSKEELNLFKIELSSYIDKKGETRKMYKLDRNAAFFIVTGFTGAKTADWRIKYIRAFFEKDERELFNVELEKSKKYKESLHKLIQLEEEKNNSIVW